MAAVVAGRVVQSYPAELRERAVARVAEEIARTGERGAVPRVAAEFGIASPETLRNWWRASYLRARESGDGGVAVGSPVPVGPVAEPDGDGAPERRARRRRDESGLPDGLAEMTLGDVLRQARHINAYAELLEKARGEAEEWKERCLRAERRVRTFEKAFERLGFKPAVEDEEGGE